MRALREAHNFLNGVYIHTLGQDKALHGFIHSVAGYQSDQYIIVDELQRLACDALVV